MMTVTTLGDQVEVTDGGRTWTMTAEQFEKMRRDPDFAAMLPAEETASALATLDAKAEA